MNTLQIHLFVQAFILLLALPCAFLPNSVMMAAKKPFNLPEYSMTPLFEYLARCLSYGVAFLGFLFVYLGLNWQIHLDLIKWFAIFFSPSPLLILWLHHRVRLPTYWFLGDLLGCIAWGVGLYAHASLYG